MHEVNDVEFPVVLWILALVLVLLSLLINYRNAAARRRVEVLKLQRLAAEEIARAEQEEAEEYSSRLLRRRISVLHHHSPSTQVISHTPTTVEESVEAKDAALCSLISTQIFVPTESSHTSVGSGLCAVCTTPTKKQCSRCKAVKYCSRECQFSHWADGHKHECQVSKKPSASTNAKVDVLPTSSEPLENPVTKEEDRHKHECQVSKKPSASTNAKVDVLLTSSEPLENLVTKEEDNSHGNGITVEETLLAAPSNSLQSLEHFTSDETLPNPSKILFSYEHFLKLFGCSDLNLVPCGLVNCGNSCFANVVLQCITFTQPLAAYLLKGRHSEECHRNRWCFMCELQQHVLQVRNSQVPFSPMRIVSQIRNIGNHLGYGRQEDAHEFMRFAIDSMQSVCLDKVGGEKAIDQRTLETTLIHHIFGGHLQSQVRCMQCQHESYKYENMMDLAVEIQGKVETLEGALSQFTTSEHLDGENMYKCDRCKDYVQAWKRLVVHEAPNILIVALKRFQSGDFGKLNKRVTFPDVLNMSPFMSEEGEKPPLYQLYGVIVHVDMLNASFFGHYICFIKDFHGAWYKIDDSKVEEVDLDNVMQQRAYMLFYTRSAPRDAPNVGMRGAQAADTTHANADDSEKFSSCNGNHTVPAVRSILSGGVANGNRARAHSNNCDVLGSSRSDFLTQ